MNAKDQAAAAQLFPSITNDSLMVDGTSRYRVHYLLFLTI